MSKHSISDKSSSAAHNRHATAPQDEEGPLPSAAATASSSLAQASSSSNPKMPLDLIANLILPFFVDRVTWNSVCCTGKELCRAGKKMTPLWPNKAFNLEAGVQHVAFSPSGSHLVSAVSAGCCQTVIHVWDRWGKQTLLAGHTGDIHCLERSSDGEHLALGSEDGSIRLWHARYFHATSSNDSRERSMPTTSQQAVTILFHDSDDVMTLSFSRTDSNLLASGGHSSGIKVWNAEEETCIHSLHSGLGAIHSLCFAGGADSAWIAPADVNSVIRLWKAEGSSDFASEVIGEATCFRGGGFHLPVFSSSGSVLATCSE
jgi:WD40 repeat protein